MSLLKKLDIKAVLIMLLCSVVLFQNIGGDDNGDIETINVDGTDYELLSQKVDTVVVEKEVTVTEYVPTTVYRTDTVRVEIPSDVDTTAILEDYFASYTVIDTLNLDYDFPNNITDSTGNNPPSTLGFGILSDVISQNKIQSRNVKWTFRVPTVYNTTIVKELPKNEFYWGFGTGLNQEDVITNVNGSFLWKTKQDRVFKLGAGIQNNSNTSQLAPYIDFGLYWKIGK